jgi:hypothetical protein
MWETRVGYHEVLSGSSDGEIEPYIWPATNTVLREDENSDKAISMDPSAVVHGTVPGG